jgi:hypothetical protein
MKGPVKESEAGTFPSSKKGNAGPLRALEFAESAGTYG